MIKVEFAHSINFIDENDIFVGFDLRFQCCEDFGWYIKDNESVDDLINQAENSNQLDEEDYLGWLFDLNYFKSDSFDTGNITCADAVVFRLKKGDKNKYLFLFNIGNGMYAHDFFFGRSINSYSTKQVEENAICFHKGEV